MNEIDFEVDQSGDLAPSTGVKLTKRARHEIAEADYIHFWPVGVHVE